MNTPDLLPSGKPRRPLRPLYGIPERDPRGRLGLVISTLFHVGIIVLLLLPPVIATSVLFDETTGGGPGPAGGGGGGTGGSGGETLKPEKLRYLQVAPIPKVSPSSITPPVVPPPKPPEVKEPEPTPTPPEPTPQTTAPTSGPTIPTPGAGGGSGHDGTGGNGPGSGGGIGSGTGTGNGSGNGPGTGGGPGLVRRSAVTMTPLLPQPVPSKVRPYTLVAVFDVDERGNAQLIAFNPSRDSGYNRKLREMLGDLRFRAATRPDGTPVRDTVKVSWEAPD